MSWAYQPLLPAAAQLQAGGTTPTYTLAADAGALALAGQGAAPHAGRRLPASAGAMSVAGQAAVLRVRRGLAGNGGAFTISGQAANLKGLLRLPASGGAIAVAGQDVPFAADEDLTDRPRSLHIGPSLGI